MAKALNKYNVELSFEANVNKAKSELMKLQLSLNGLVKAAEGSKLNSALDKAGESAKTLQEHLHKATDSFTGKLDAGALGMSLKKANVDMQQLGKNMFGAGRKGQEAFISFAKHVNAAGVPIKKTNTALTELWTTMKNTMRWQLTSGMLHGFVGTLQKAVGFAKDLDGSLNRIRIVTGKSSDEMAKFAVEANKAAKALDSTTTRYTDAALVYYQQGDDEDLVKAKTAVTIKAANVAGSSAAQMSEYLTAVWNSYKVGSGELEVFVDKLAAVGATTASTLEEIATAMTKVAATANTVGVNFDQLTSIIATVSSVTRVSSETVGVAFKTIFARIGDLKISGIDEDGITLGLVSSQLQAMGVNILDTNGTIREMGSVVEEVGDKWQGWTKNQQMAIAQAIAGKRQYTQLMALFENWDKYRDTVGVSEGAEGTLQQQADIFAESWEGASNRVRVNLETVFHNAINADAFIKITNALAGIVGFVSQIVEGFGGIGNILFIVAGYLTQKFAGSITESIGKTIHNIKVELGLTQKAALSFNKIMNDSLKEMASGNNVPTELKAEAALIYKMNKSMEEYEAKKKAGGDAVSDSLRMQYSLQEALYQKELERIRILKENREILQGPVGGTNILKEYDKSIVPLEKIKKPSILTKDFEAPIEPKQFTADEIAEKTKSLNPIQAERLKANLNRNYAKDLAIFMERDRDFAEYLVLKEKIQKEYDLKVAEYDKKINEAANERGVFTKKIPKLQEEISNWSDMDVKSSVVAEKLKGFDTTSATAPERKLLIDDLSGLLANNFTDFYKKLPEETQKEFVGKLKRFNVFKDSGKSNKDFLNDMNGPAFEKRLTEATKEGADPQLLINIKKEYEALGIVSGRFLDNMGETNVSLAETVIKAKDLNKEQKQTLLNLMKQNKEIKGQKDPAVVATQIIGLGMSAVGMLTAVGHTMNNLFNDSVSGIDKVAQGLTGLVSVAAQTFKMVQTLQELGAGAASGLIGGVVAVAIIAIQFIISLIKKKEELKKQAVKERVDLNKEIDARKELIESYNDLYSVTNKTIDEKKTLWQKTEELCSQYDIEILKTDRLIENYKKYNEEISEKRKLELEKGLSETGFVLNDTIAPIKKKFSKTGLASGNTYQIDALSNQQTYGRYINTNDENYKEIYKKNNMRYIPTIGSDSSGVRSYSSDTAGAYNTYITAKDVRDEYVKTNYTDKNGKINYKDLKDDGFYKELSANIGVMGKALKESNYLELRKSSLSNISELNAIGTDTGQITNLTEYSKLIEDTKALMTEQAGIEGIELTDDDIKKMISDFEKGLSGIDDLIANHALVTKVEAQFVVKDEREEEANARNERIVEDFQKMTTEQQVALSLAMDSTAGAAAKSWEELSVVVDDFLTQAKIQLAESALKVLVSLEFEDYNKKMSDADFAKLEGNAFISELIAEKFGSMDTFKKLDSGTQKAFTTEAIVKTNQQKRQGYKDQISDSSSKISVLNDTMNRGFLGLPSLTGEKIDLGDIAAQIKRLKEIRAEAKINLIISTEADWAQIDSTNSKGKSLESLKRILKQGGKVDAVTARSLQDIWPEFFKGAVIKDGMVQLNVDFGLNLSSKISGEMQEDSQNQLNSLKKDEIKLKKQKLQLDKKENKTKAELIQLNLIDAAIGHVIAQQVSIQVFLAGALNDILDSNIDKYYVITKQLELQEKALSLISKQKANAYGGKASGYLQREINMQKAIIENNKILLEQAKTATAKSAKNLENKYGAKFSNGVMTNYEDFMGAYGEDKTAMDEFSDYEKNLDKKLSAIETIYDRETAAATLEIEKITSGLNLEIELKDDTIKKLDILILGFDDVFANAYKVFENMIAKGDLSDGLLKQGNEFETTLDGLLGRLEGGQENASELVGKIREVMGQYGAEIGNLVELDNQIKEYYGNTLNTGISELKEYGEKLKNNNAMLSHLKSVISLAGIKDGQGVSKDGNKIQTENNLLLIKLSLDSVKVLKDQEQAMIEAGMGGTEAYKNLKDSITATNLELVESTKAALESLKGLYSEQIDEIVKDLEEKIAGNYKSFELLENKYQRETKKNERYVGEVEKVFSITKLQNSVEESIRSTSSKAGKEKLMLAAEELKALETKKDVTQYELDMAAAKYDIALKTIALEEAQNAKSKVRLVRDSSGNMSYQYTADSKNIAKAEADLLESTKNMYDIAETRSKDLATQSIQNSKDMAKAVDDYAKSFVGTQEEFEIGLEEILLFYQDNANFLLEQAGITSGDLAMTGANVISLASDDIATSLARQSAASEANKIAMESSYNLSGIAVQEFKEKAGKAWREYQAGIADVLETSGLDLDGLSQKTKDVGIASKEVSDILFDPTTGLIKGLGDTLEGVRVLTEGWLENGTQIDILKGQYETFNTRLEETIEKLKEAKELKDLLDLYDSKDKDPFKPTKTLEEFLDNPNVRTFAGQNQKLMNYIEKALSADGGGDFLKFLLGEAFDTSKYSNTIFNPLTFDSGGYTGDWGKDGRLAFLHQKEIVLNQSDTTNILAAVQGIRSLSPAIMKMIGAVVSSGASASRQFNASIPNMSMGSAKDLNQKVEISASFPGVSSASEIEQALKQLVNDAAKYVT